VSARSGRAAGLYRGTFGAQTVPAYRRYVFGQQSAQVGQWTQVLAEAWLALELSGGSGFAVGSVTAARFLPAFLLGPWIGVLVDRTVKRRTLIRCELLIALCATVLGFTVLLSVADLTTLLVLCLLSGGASAVEITTRLAYVVEVAGYENAGNASALTGASFNLARIVGPVFGGVLISTGNIELCFFGNAAAYLWSAVSLVRIRSLTSDVPPQGARKGQLREGLRYLTSHRELRRTIALTGWCFACANNVNVILPVLAKQDLHGAASTFSHLTAAIGLGALLGVPLAASRRHYGVRLAVVSTLAFGATLVVASLAPGLSTMLAALAAVGVSELVFMTSVGTLVQLRADPPMLGRVLALRGVVTQGATPFGALLAGALVDVWGARAGLAAGGLGILVGAALYAGASACDLPAGSRPRFRRAALP
jgi:predicted MFS family arabinose efflux permease